MPAFDTDLLIPCPDHGRDFIVRGIIDDYGDPALIVNCRLCGEIYSSPEEYDKAVAHWNMLTA
jgi:hypothetical protein